MSVILYATDVTSIRNVQDRLSNILASSTGPWNLELKIYRSNPASFRNEPAELIYTITSNQQPDTVWLFTKQQSLVCDQELMPIINSKLKSLWVSRQTFKVEGEAYKLGDAEICVGNAFLSGNFKGLVLEIWVNSTDETYIQKEVTGILERLEIKASADQFASTRLDLAKQYAKLNK